jgi:8-amino-7-oxononanoate synthase
VAPGTARLRVTLCAAHTEEDVAQLAAALNELEGELDNKLERTGT